MNERRVWGMLAGWAVPGLLLLSAAVASAGSLSITDVNAVYDVGPTVEASQSGSSLANGSFQICVGLDQCYTWSWSGVSVSTDGSTFFDLTGTLSCISPTYGLCLSGALSFGFSGSGFTPTTQFTESGAGSTTDTALGGSANGFFTQILPSSFTNPQPWTNDASSFSGSLAPVSFSTGAGGTFSGNGSFLVGQEIASTSTTFNLDITFAPEAGAPEPATLLLTGLGLAAVCWKAGRKAHLKKTVPVNSA